MGQGMPWHNSYGTGDAMSHQVLAVNAMPQQVWAGNDMAEQVWDMGCHGTAGMGQEMPWHSRYGQEMPCHSRYGEGDAMPQQVWDMG